MKALVTALSMAAVLGAASSVGGADGPWTAVDSALGREGRDLPGEVRKYGFPRSDLHVTARGVAIEAPLALGSWAAFHAAAEGSMVMGDLVLLPAELNPVIRRLHEGGLEIGAIHNHLAGEQPQVLYVHFSGMGPAEALAGALRGALDLTKTPMGAPRPAAPLSAAQHQAFEALQAALGRKGAMAGRVLQVSVPRSDHIEEAGMEIPPAMGMAIALNFQTAGTRIATTGDFVLTADEVNPVVRELQARGIDVTALHSHMLRETPRLFFLHFWGVGTPEKIGEGLKAALSKIAAK